jgi:hypothetical protein
MRPGPARGPGSYAGRMQGLDVFLRGDRRRSVGPMMKVLRAIGRWLGKVLSEGGPPAVGSSGERMREQSMVQDTHRQL